MIFSFNSQIQVRGTFSSDFSQTEIKNEPMFFNSDLEFAEKNAGPITKAFIQNLPEDWKNANPVLDSKVCMLMNGWFPCIPGLHHDDVPRSRSDGQPNYRNPEYRAEHLMGLVNAEICPTLFALGEHQLPEIELGKVISKEWHPMIQKQIEDGVLEKWICPSGTYVQFDWQATHEGQKAIGSGWRIFLRLSRNTDRQKKMTNEIRRQVQVYMDANNLNEGW